MLEAIKARAEYLAAAEYGHEFIGTEHLLLAIIDDEKVVSHLQSQNLSHSKIKEHLERLLQRCTPATFPSKLPISQYAKEAIKNTLKYNSEIKVEPLDMLKSLTQNENGIASHVLGAAGYNAEK